MGQIAVRFWEENIQAGTDAVLDARKAVEGLDERENVTAKYMSVVVDKLHVFVGVVDEAAKVRCLRPGAALSSADQYLCCIDSSLCQPRLADHVFCLHSASPINCSTSALR
jgi:hypothetical protein